MFLAFKLSDVFIMLINVLKIVSILTVMSITHYIQSCVEYMKKNIYNLRAWSETP